MYFFEINSESGFGHSSKLMYKAPDHSIWLQFIVRGQTLWCYEAELLDRGFIQWQWYASDLGKSTYKYYHSEDFPDTILRE